MKVKTSIKAGGLNMNHNETFVCKGLKVKTSIKAGGVSVNHNENLVRGAALKTKSE